MRLLRTVSTIAAVLALVLVAPSAASATSEPGASLNLNFSAPGVSLQVFTIQLTCHPTGGGDAAYIDADGICSDLTAINGDFNALPGYPFINCANYRGWAIRTWATGHWFGQPVHYDVLHANICEAKKATGRIFLG